MCTNGHDGTCTAILARSKTQPNQLIARLVCERCDEVVRILGVVEHTLGPVLTRTPLGFVEDGSALTQTAQALEKVA